MAKKTIRGSADFKPELGHSLDIEHLISAPLIAAAKANSYMARDQTQFIMDFCFGKEGDQYVPVMIDMSITHSVLLPNDNKNDQPKLEQYTTVIKLPLITILPINSLAVEKVNVKFDMEITTQSQTRNESETLASTNKSGPTKKTSLKGRLSYSSEERTSGSGSQTVKKHNTSSLSVNIDAGTLPLPVGIHTLLDVYTKAIKPIEIGKKEGDSGDGN